MTAKKTNTALPLCVPAASASDSADRPYSHVFNSPETNTLLRVNAYGNKITRPNALKPNVVGVLVDSAFYQCQAGNLTDFDQIVMMFLITKFSKMNTLGEPPRDRTIQFSIPEFMAMRNVADTKENRKKVKKSIAESFERLSATVVSFTSKATSPFNKKKEDVEIKSVLTEGMVTFRGGFTIALGTGFANYLCQTATVPIHHSLFTVDARINRAFQTGFHLAVHYRIKSAERKSELNHEYANRIRIGNLAERAGFPTFDKVKQQDRHFMERIVKPIFKALDHLVEKGYLTEYALCRKDGTVLTVEERTRLPASDYEDLYISFQLATPPVNGVIARILDPMA